MVDYFVPFDTSGVGIGCISSQAAIFP